MSSTANGYRYCNYTLSGAKFHLNEYLEIFFEIEADRFGVAIRPVYYGNGNIRCFECRVYVVQLGGMLDTGISMFDDEKIMACYKYIARNLDKKDTLTMQRKQAFLSRGHQLSQHYGQG